MDEALIAALENRIALGEDKEALRAEVLSHGHDTADFEVAYAAAYQRVHNSDDTSSVSTEPQIEDTAVPLVSRARGDLHTLAVERPRNGLIGYFEMLQAGWRIGNEALPVTGGFLLALLLLFPLTLAGVAILGGLAVTLTDTATTVIFLLVLVVVGYFAVIIYITSLGFAFFRGILKRTEPKPVFWPHFRWVWAHIIGLVLVSLYVQIITNAGFVVFFIPGLIAAVYLGYALYVYVDEDVPGFDALIRSFELVYGHFWAILGRKVFLILVIFLTAIPVGIALTVYPPAGILMLLLAVAFGYFVVCSTIALFESLQSLPPKHQFSSTDRTTIKTWLRIVVVVAIIFGIFSFYTSAISFDLERELGEFQHFLAGMDAADEQSGASEIPTSFTRQELSSVALIKDQLSTARVSAELYYGSNNASYQGVCSRAEGINTNMRYAFDAGAAQVSCEDGARWFIAEAELLDTGIFYCIDSTGYAQENSSSRSNYQACRDEAEVSDADQPVQFERE